ncbi:MAG: trigger factor [Candidatus Brocadiia bacterium]
MANVIVEDVGPCKKHLKITIPKEDIEKKVEENYKRLAGSAAVAGFRKGRVPRKLLERRFSDDVLEDVKQSILSEASQKAVEEKGLKPIGDPSFDNVAFELNKDCVFEITLEVEPDFDLPVYKGLELTRARVWVDDEEITRGLDALRMQRARLDLMPAGTPVAADDAIVCDWKIVSEGETVADQKDAELHVHGRRSGGLEMEQDLSEALAGAKFGESREIKAKFGDSYPVEKWRGKDGTLTVEIKEIRRPVAPELNEEFAKAMDFDSLEDLKKAVLHSITQSKEREAALALEQQAFDRLLAAAPFELPQGVLKAQARNIMLRQQYRLRQRGVPAEEIEKHMDDLRNASEESAARNLKIYFILDRIAEKEKIFVTEDEVEARIAAMAGGYNLTPQRMRAQIEQEGSLSELRGGLRENKVVDFLLKSAKIEEAK